MILNQQILRSLILLNVIFLNFTYKFYNHIVKTVNTSYEIQNLIKLKNNILLLLKPIQISIWHDFSNV